ncbi:MAG TPA: cyclic-phosphate processing receiver domain-containing protein [Pyrinomonadaceae bacterium]|nr:cyclic-phosphate processing receiver domain-containing protein [Pyrinomonadaceae bacterium]
MSLIRSLLNKLGFNNVAAERSPIRVFLLEDDKRRHQWFVKRFVGDHIDIADTVTGARELLSANPYDALFLDHDLHPEHYNSATPDDERTGYAIASWLAANPELQRAATIVVHTRNADGAIRMVEKLRGSGRAAEFVPFPLLGERIKHYWKR